MIIENELNCIILKGNRNKEEMLDKYGLSIKTVLGEVEGSNYTKKMFLNGQKLVYVLMKVTFNYEDQEPTHEYECLAFKVPEEEAINFANSTRLEERISNVALTDNYQGLLENMRDNGTKVESVETKLEYVIKIPFIKATWYEEEPECIYSSDMSSYENF